MGSRCDGEAAAQRIHPAAPLPAGRVGRDRREIAAVLTAMARTVAQWLDSAAHASPGKAVLTGPRGALTWRELDARAGAVARHLRDEGVGPGDRLAIATEDLTDMAIGIVA